MKDLQKLKQELLKQEPSEKDLIYCLCAVMEICGGYEQLLSLPLPALKAIVDYLNYKAKETEKSMPKTPHFRKR